MRGGDEKVSDLVNFSMDGSFESIDFSKSNSSFYSGVVRILTLDTVAHGVRFSKESVEKSLPTLKNTPLVALTKLDELDLGFGGHESKVAFKDGKKTISCNTHPVGIIPESAKQWFATSIVNGVEKLCLYSHCLLWKRQEAFDVFQAQDCFAVSTEVTIHDGKYNGSVYDVESFTFTATAILGNDKNPAFKGSNIKTFSEDEDFATMMFELKEYMKENLGGEQMEDEVKVVVEEEVLVSESSMDCDSTYATKVVEDIIVEETVTTVTETKTIVVVEEESQSTHNDAIVVDRVEVEVSTGDDSDGHCCNAQFEQMKKEFEEMQVEYGKVVAELNDMKVEFDRLKQFEEVELAEKRKLGEEKLFAKFEDICDVNELTELISHSVQFSLEELDDKCYALAGKKMLSEKKKVKPNKDIKLAFEENTKSTIKSFYGGYATK